MNFISKCRKRLSLFFHSLSLRVVLPYGWPSPPVNGSRSHRTHSLNLKKKKKGAGGRVKRSCYSLVSAAKWKTPGSSTGPPGLQGHMIPLPMEESDQAFHFLPARHSAVQMPAWVLVTESRSCMHKRQGPLPVCCLCRICPLSLFSVSGKKKKKVSITKERTWMVALLVGGALLVHLYNHHRCKRPKPTTAKLSRNLDFMCWSDKQDDVVFVALTSLSLMVKSRLLTIFIHWALKLYKCESHQPGRSLCFHLSSCCTRFTFDIFLFWCTESNLEADYR